QRSGVSGCPALSLTPLRCVRGSDRHGGPNTVNSCLVYSRRTAESMRMWQPAPAKDGGAGCVSGSHWSLPP
ncbi:MAG TPA: hypothetical protein VH592_25605, partial [Gemmataceae bacterium]